MTTPAVTTGADRAKEKAVEVAPAWKLMLWRFRKHKLAVVSAWVLLLIGLVTIAPEFFSIQNPETTSARRAFIPPQVVRIFHEGRLVAPFVYAVEGNRDPRTLAMKWEQDPSTRVPLRFFTRGFDYKLFGLISTNVHLMGAADGTSPIHLVGTDRLGRDQWSRLMFGTRISMSIGLVAVALSVFLGVLLGGISGYMGGITDVIIQRTIELLQSMPAIPIWLALSAAVPRTWSVERVYFAITIILALIGWTQLGRQVRGRFLALREEDFVTSARLIGSSRRRIIFSHMVPSFMSHIIASTTLAIPLMIINETFLSFLGLGLRPPAISWGVLLQEAQNLQSVVNAPWLLLPGVAVVITVLVLNILGDGIRDAADPYSN